MSEPTPSIKKSRSRAYPVMALGDALNKLRNINANLGINGRYNRESIAVGMGYSSLSGASTRAVAAMVQYGLLSREKDLYHLSELAKRYLLPVADNDQELSSRSAALKPSLFNDIYTAFKGQVIPRQFQNRLVHEFGIQQNAAADVERIFRETLVTAGILHDNGIIEDTPVVAQSTPSTGNDADTEVGLIETPGDTKHTERQEHKNDNISPTLLSVKLPSGLIVSYPQELASAFAFGLFGSELKALDEAISRHTLATITASEG